MTSESSRLSIGATIRKRRHKLSLTQAYLGKMAGLRQATVNDVENGKACNVNTLLAICEVLGCRVVIK
jgi:DNA-binding XRE family transcriptional regulator